MAHFEAELQEYARTVNFSKEEIDIWCTLVNAGRTRAILLPVNQKPSIFLNAKVPRSNAQVSRVLVRHQLCVGAMALVVDTAGSSFLEAGEFLQAFYYYGSALMLFPETLKLWKNLYRAAAQHVGDKVPIIHALVRRNKLESFLSGLTFYIKQDFDKSIICFEKITGLPAATLYIESARHAIKRMKSKSLNGNKVGWLGEKAVHMYLLEKYEDIKNTTIDWRNESVEKHEPFDITVTHAGGIVEYIEVKTNIYLESKFLRLSHMQIEEAHLRGALYSIAHVILNKPVANVKIYKNVWELLTKSNEIDPENQEGNLTFRVEVLQSSRITDSVHLPADYWNA